MAIDVTCDECGKSTDDVICRRCAETTIAPAGLDESALHDLARAIALRDADEAFMALDVLIRDFSDATAMRERIAIARATV